MNVRENSFSHTRQNLYLHCKTSCPLGDGGRGEILGARQECKVVRQGFVLNSTHFLSVKTWWAKVITFGRNMSSGHFFFLLFYFSHSKLSLRPVPPCAFSPERYSRFQDEARAPPTDILGEGQALSTFTRDFSPEFGPTCQKLFKHIYRWKFLRF